MLDLLHEFLNGYLEFKDKNGKTSIAAIKINIRSIIAGFNASEEKNIEFRKVNKLLESLKPDNSKVEKSKSASLFSKLKKKDIYNKGLLKKAIEQDLNILKSQLKA